jgi:uncharacterized protein (DUF305 family)
MRHWTLPSVLVVAFGCATSAPESSMGGASPGEADVASEADAGADDVAPEQLVVDGRYSDERFLDMMAAHHAMAIAMAQVELQHGARPETLQLARAIIATQTSEIAELRRWKRQLYGTDRVTLRMNPEQMQNSGTIAADELANQQNVDLAFIDSMIPHHASALVLASVARLQSHQEGIVKMARGIIDAQSREIGEMIGWRER